MPKQEHPLTGLSHFLPDDTLDAVLPYFKEHKIYLTLTRHRETRLGDYRAPTREQPYHRISVNTTLNKYSFLITLLHEIAHLTTQVLYGNKAAPHGIEWKKEFQKVLIPFVGKDIFPPEVEKALQAYFRNPAASTCTDPKLYKALARYDERAADLIHADEVPIGGKFELGDKVFEKLENLRTRSRCVDVASGRIYFVQGVALVKMPSKL